MLNARLNTVIPKTHMKIIDFSSTVFCILIAPSFLSADEISDADLKFFESKIRPVLVKECYKCHSIEAKKSQGGFRLDTRKSLRDGGESGPAIVPGKPEESLLIEALRHESFEMPPSGRLDDAIIEDFVVWIQRGAPDPRRGKSRSDQSTDSALHWSFQAPVRPSIPQVQNDAWPRTDLDYFILQKQEAAGVRPVDDAHRRVWIRRVTFDLIGLPPTPSEVETFLYDESPQAYEKVVDRLLDSPHFGERWGRHWLDVARYGESTGHKRNFTFPHAWRFRDYVIHSFNVDKPYDQFIREQIAGDLLPAENWQQRDEQNLGTGFLAIGPKDLIMGSDSQYWADVVDDQIDATCQTFLGLTVSCARCHDHKFDPIPTKDYYALAGIFHSAETLYGTNPGSGAGSNAHPSELYALGENGAEQNRIYLEFQEKLNSLVKPIQQAENALKKARDSKEPVDNIPELEQNVKKVHQQRKELLDASPPRPDFAMAMREKEKPTNAHVLIAGDAKSKGDLVPRGFLSLVKLSDTPTIDEDNSGRLALAEWLVAPENPLTARVMVNRIWQHLFGEGIVPSVNNFGATGKSPTHPELLDYLATQFVEDGWSIKRAIRRLVLSRTYRLASTHDDKNFAVEPDNVTLWRMRSRRLEGEIIRDSMLVVSGRFEPGPPEHGSVVTDLGDGCLVRQLDPEPLFQSQTFRSVYLPTCRFFVPEILEIFDGPSPSLVTGARAVTNVPSQTLYLLNNDFVVEQSQAAAQRLLKDGAGKQQRIDLLYQTAFNRRPTSSEFESAIEFIQNAQQTLSQRGQPNEKAVQTAWAAFCQAVFTSAEFRYIH